MKTTKEDWKKCLVMFYTFEEMINNDYGLLQREIYNIQEMSLSEMKPKILELYEKHKNTADDPNTINQEFWQKCLKEIREFDSSSN